MKLAVAYARCSTDMQETSNEDQLKDIRRFAADQGYSITESFEDFAVSGREEMRPAFQRMLKFVADNAGHIDAVLVYDVSRWGRFKNPKKATYFEVLVEDAAAEVIYVAEGIPTGRGVGSYVTKVVKDCEASSYSLKLSKVTARGQISVTQKGFSSGRLPPYGYDRAVVDREGRTVCIVRQSGPTCYDMFTADGRLIQRLPKGQGIPKSPSDRVKLIPGNPAHVAIVRRIFERYAYQGMGQRSIADELNRQGVPSPESGTWSAATVRAILMNPVYKGQLVYNRHNFSDLHRITKHGESHQIDEKDLFDRSRTIHNPEYSWVTNDPGCGHEPLVSPELWELARQRRERLAAKCVFKGPSVKATYILTGLITCTNCGHPYTGYTVHSSKGYVTRYYSCSGRINKGKSTCVSHRVPQQDLERHILARVRNLISPRKILDAVLEMATREAESHKASLTAIDAELKQLDRRLQDIIQTIEPRNRDLVNTELDRLRSQNARLEQQRSQLCSAAAAGFDREEIADKVGQCLARLDEVLESGTPQERREIVHCFVHDVQIDPNRNTADIGYYPVGEAVLTQSATVSMVAGAGFEPATSGL